MGSFDMNKYIDRVRDLMMDQGLDTENDKLVLKIGIIYLEAQKDQIKEDMNK